MPFWTAQSLPVPRPRARSRLFALASLIASCSLLGPYGTAPVAADPAEAELPIPLPGGADGGLPFPIPKGGDGGGLPFPIPKGGNGGLPFPIPKGGGEGGLPIKLPKIKLPDLDKASLPQLGAPVKMFGEVKKGILYRSSQPSPEGFAWLHSLGIESVVNLRAESDDNADELAAIGIKHYLHIPIEDNHPPTNEQAEQFLAYVHDSSNWPILVHCNMGIGRSGTMSVLTRYAVDGVLLDDAFSESVLFGGGPWPQLTWLQGWAQSHPPGDHPLS